MRVRPTASAVRRPSRVRACVPATCRARSTCPRPPWWKTAICCRSIACGKPLRPAASTSSGRPSPVAVPASRPPPSGSLSTRSASRRSASMTAHGRSGARALSYRWRPARNNAGAAMIFRQLYDGVSGTYTYLIASRRGGEALIVDPVIEKVDRYLQLVTELQLRLVKAVDTHMHADHITGLGALRDRTRCITVMGEQSKADVVSMRIAEGDRLTIEGVALDVLYTPGHTDDSYSFVMGDRVFSGDTLLIRGTGRTDFQNGDACAQYDSIFGKLLKLPDETLVYPAHDYKGDTVSTIGEEKRYNPRLRVKSIDEYVDLMNKLDLPNPKMMDVAIPANMKVGLAQDEVAKRGWALTAAQAIALVGRPEVALIDLRETSERDKHGVIPGSLHAPYPDLNENISYGGMLHELAAATSKRLLFYCAFG